MKKIIIIQFIVLLIGTAFAWFNFSKELIGPSTIFGWIKASEVEVYKMKAEKH